MTAIRLENLSKAFASGTVAPQGLNLAVNDGELLALVGPSGCGKTTTLRLIAGLETPSSGRVCFDDRDVTSLPPRERDVGMVFQDHSLYPHLTVRDNLTFGLRLRGVSRDEIARRVASASQLLRLEELLDRWPNQLSGGQQQRVALARTVARGAKVFLWDEPLSSLDPHLRAETRRDLADARRQLAITTLLVTHDQAEALALGDRIAVMNHGELQQIGTPNEVFQRPANLLVATFLGAPAMNLLPFEYFSKGQLADSFAQDFVTAKFPRFVGIRPTDVSLEAADGRSLAGQIVRIEPRGVDVVLHLRLSGTDEQHFSAVASLNSSRQIGDVVGIHCSRETLHFFDANGRRIAR